MVAENFEYGLYDKKSVTPGYFGTPPKENSIDRLKSLGAVVEDKEEPTLGSSILKSIKKKNEKSLIEKTKDIVSEPLRDIGDGAKILGSDIAKIQRGELDKTEGLLGKLLQVGEDRVDRIKQLNDDIDATGGSSIDKTIATGLNIFGAGVDFTGEALVSSLKTIAPQGVEDFTAEKIQEFGQSETGKQIMGFIEKGGGAVEGFASSSPEASRLVESIKSVLPIVEVAGVGLGGKAIKEAGEIALDATKQSIDSAGDIIKESIPKIQDGLDSGKQAISTVLPGKPGNIAESIAGIDEKTKNILKEVDTEDFDMYVTAGKDAAENIKNPTPLAIAGDKAGDVLEQIKLRRSQVGAEKAEILKKVETQTIPTQDIYDDFNNFLSDRFNLQIDGKTLELVEIPGKKANIGDSSISDLKGMSDELLDLFTSDDVSLGNLDAIVDRIQDGINFNKLDRPGGNASSTEKQISGFLEGSINQRLKESAGDAFVEANSNFRKIIDIQNRLEKALGDGGDKGSSLMKTVFSPQTGQKTLRLFKEIQEEFGVDLTNEAGMAKFAMQLSGDSRQANLLEALDLGTGFSSKLSQKLQGTVLSPIIEAGEKISQKVFNPETVGRKITEQ